MLGRKAILHAQPKGKKKWQLEQEKIKKKSCIESESDVSEDEHAEDVAEEKGDDKAEEAKSNQPEKTADKKENSTDKGVKRTREEEDDDDDDDEDDGGGKKKQFAWMDSDDDEASDGGGEEGKKATGADKVARLEAQSDMAVVGIQVSTSTTAIPSRGVPLASSAQLASLGLPAVSPLAVSANRPGMLRPLRPPPVLPPGTKVPALTQEHMHLMFQVAGSKTLDDLWDIIDRRCEAFAPAHAALSLHKLTMLAGIAMGGDILSARLDRHASFSRLCDRLDDLVATAEGRGAFMAADLAMVSAGLAKVVSPPATSGAIGRIFAELADETESRIGSEPSAFTLPMLADIAWGIAKSGTSRGGFLRVLISAILSGPSAKKGGRLLEATCQDLANFAMAFAEASFHDADDFLRLIFEQTRERLLYVPPATSPLHGVLAVPLPPTVALPLNTACQVLPPDGFVQAIDGTKNSMPLWQLTGQWRFSGGQMSEIATCVSKHIGLYDEKLFRAIAQAFSVRLQDFTVPQLVKLRDAFDLVRHESDVEFMFSLRTALKSREFAYRRGGPLVNTYVGGRR